MEKMEKGSVLSSNSKPSISRQCVLTDPSWTPQRKDTKKMYQVKAGSDRYTKVTRVVSRTKPALTRDASLLLFLSTT